ncbi:Myb-like DNA-binding domain-containing protein [Microdochium nivale]|nr:Myb-like DNA-binding domain-containing protein [Microdochium nivale]
MSRQTRRSTRQTASNDELPGLPQRSSQLTAQPRHPIARRGTRRSQQSRRSVSVDHVKSSADIGYDDTDDDAANDDSDENAADTIAPAPLSQGAPSEEDMMYLEETASELVLSCDSIYALYNELGMDEPTRKQSLQRSIRINRYKSALGKLAEDDYLDLSAPLWNASDAWAQQLPVQPRNIAYRSNTVSLLNNLHDLLHDINAFEGSSFEQLDNTFPAQFALTYDLSWALNLAFRIRCHHFYANLRGSEKPVLLAARMFCGEEYTVLNPARQRLANGPYKPFLGLELADGADLYDIYQGSMRRLLDEVLNGRSTQAVRDNMEILCPKSALLEDLHLWAMGAYEKLATTEAAKGEEGTATVEEPVASEAGDEEDGSSDSDTEMMPIEELGAPTTGSYFDGTATISRPVSGSLVAAREAPSVQGVNIQVRLQNSVRELDVSDILDDQGGSLSQTREASPIFASSSRPAVAQLDHRAANDDVEMAGVDSDDPFDDEDDDFERRTVPVDLSRRMANAQSSQPAQGVRVWRRSPIAAPATSRRSYHTAHVPMPNQTQRHLETSLPLSQFATKDAQRKRLAIQGKREQGRRVPWKAEEEQLLLDLISKHGCSWSLIEDLIKKFIEDHGGSGTPRSQQACRDKARNLKVAYLSGNYTLPKMFDEVKLGPKERYSVLRAGGNPARKEHDIDEHGNVINFLDPATLEG